MAPMERAAEQRLCMLGHAVHCELKQIAWHGLGYRAWDGWGEGQGEGLQGGEGSEGG